MLEHYSHVRMEVKRAALDQVSSGLMGPQRRPEGEREPERGGLREDAPKLQ